MKCLIISPSYVLPEDTGARMRTMNFVRFFKQYGTIDLVYCDQTQQGAISNDNFRNQYCLELKPHVMSLKDRIFRLGKGIPWAIGEYSQESEAKLLSLIEAEDYDIILARHLLNSAALFKLPERFTRRIIVDFDDLLSDTLYKTYGGFYLQFRRKLDLRILKNYERRCLRFGAATFCSEDDRNKMTNSARSNAHVVPNIFQNESFYGHDFGDGFDQRNIILFVGTLDYMPNMEGLIWFIETILPSLRKEYQNAELLIAGRSPREQLLNICNQHKHIRVFSDVKDIRLLYKKCGVVIVPLLNGGGTRIKILEAGFANRPVLSTPVGAYGLNLRDRKELLLFADGNSFLSRYAMLGNETLYHHLVSNLKEVVVSKYSISNFNGAMEKVLISLSLVTEIR